MKFKRLQTLMIVALVILTGCTIPSSTIPRLKSTILSMYSIRSGHSSSHAPQVVQDQIASSSNTFPMSGFPFRDGPVIGKVS